MAAIVFPANPSNAQTFTASNGTTYVYNGSSGYWGVQVTGSAGAVSIGDTAPSNPVNGQQWFNSTTLRTYIYYNSQWIISHPVGLQGATGASGGAASVTVYTDTTSLPLSGNDTGDQAFVTSNNRLYIWNGTGWYNISLVNTAPSIDSGIAASYALATDGTPTVITITASDAEEIPLTYSYSVTSGSLGTTATVSQENNVFTITPGTTDPDDAGTFSLTFTVSDGINTDTATSSFALSFSLTISAYTTGSNWTANASNFVQETDTFTPPNNPSVQPEEVIALSEDGTRLFVAGYNSGIRSFTLSTPYSVSTAVEDNKFLDVYGTDRDTDPNIQNIREMQISADGKRLWVHNTFGAIAQFTLDTGFDLTGGHTYDGQLSPGHSTTRGFSISWDGNYLYSGGTGTLAGQSRFRVHQLTVPYDITGGHTFISELNISSIDNQAGAIFMNPTGTTAYLGFSVNDEIREYSLSTAHDISTGTYTNRFFDTTPATGTLGSISMKSDGTKGWLVKNTGLITRFRTGL